MRRRSPSPLSRLLSAAGTLLLIAAVALALGEWGAGRALTRIAARQQAAEIGAAGTRGNGGEAPALGGPKVFVLGGAAVLGSGVADGQTIPAALEAALRAGGKASVDVINFGVGDSDSTGDRILLERLLTSGIKPDLAILIDGPNDFLHCPPPSQKPSAATLSARLAARSSIIALVRRWRTDGRGQGAGLCAESLDAERAIRRLDTNRRMIAAIADRLGFKLLVVTPPPSRAPLPGFDRLTEMHGAGQLSDGDQLWLAELAPGDGDPAFANHAIADAIAQKVLSAALLP